MYVCMYVSLRGKSRTIAAIYPSLQGIHQNLSTDRQTDKNQKVDTKTAAAFLEILANSA